MGNQKLIIAIDGPAGSGKSTVTHLLSKKLNYTHIDTGALYRAIAFRANELELSQDDGKAVGALAEKLNLSFKDGQIHIDDRNVAPFIRTPEISSAASKISAHSEVRNALLGLQRKMGALGGVVLEGRDIGTVVFPNADLKFFLTADVESRAKRRQIELESKGTYLDLEEVMRQVADRDKADTERKIAPLRKAEDAKEIDTTHMTIEEVVTTLTKIAKEKEKMN